MNGEYFEITVYLNNSKKEVPQFKPHCEYAFFSKDRWGHSIFKCKQTEENCVSTKYLNGMAHEPLIVSDEMKTCPGNPNFKGIEKKVNEN